MENRLLEKLEKGEHVFGISFMEFASAGWPTTFANCGFDFLFIDMEHSTLSMETIGKITWACRAAGISPIIRVPEAQRHFISRVLDAGAHGFIVPRVETVEQVENAIAFGLFPPQGERSISASGRHFDLARPDNIEEATQKLNKQTMIGVQIETKKGLENIDKLLEHPLIDMVFTGPSDMALTLGIPHDPRHPEVQAAFEKIIHTALKYGHIPGMQALNVDFSKEMIQKGMRFVVCGAAISLIRRYGSEIVNELREFTK